mmetsp:Transcript_96675/g.275950  ORF Transcript_96675/g.275950 Transcript_96675/m.275950 type:complete len:262 (+) Transcript_96675:431-1216(+)
MLLRARNASGSSHMRPLFRFPPRRVQAATRVSGSPPSSPTHRQRPNVVLLFVVYLRRLYSRWPLLPAVYPLFFHSPNCLFVCSMGRLRSSCHAQVCIKPRSQPEPRRKNSNPTRTRAVSLTFINDPVLVLHIFNSVFSEVHGFSRGWPMHVDLSKFVHFQRVPWSLRRGERPLFLLDLHNVLPISLAFGDLLIPRHHVSCLLLVLYRYHFLFHLVPILVVHLRRKPLLCALCFLLLHLLQLDTLRLLTGLGRLLLIRFELL